MNDLSETDFKSNLKQAFNATDKESIVRVVDYADFLNKKNLDRLSIMTYLYQIREKYDPSEPCSISYSTKSKTLHSFNQETKVTKQSSYSATPTSTEKKGTKALTIRNDCLDSKQIKNSFFNPFDSEEDESVKEKNFQEKKRGIIEIASDEVEKSQQKNQTPDKKVLF